MTPDKINAVTVIRRLLESINHRQSQMEDLWQERRRRLEQTLELRVFEKALQKVLFSVGSFTQYIVHYISLHSTILLLTVASHIHVYVSLNDCFCMMMALFGASFLREPHENQEPSVALSTMSGWNHLSIIILPNVSII